MDARRERLAHLLRERSYLPVSVICEQLGVSEATARRDLAALERDQRIVRTYGGALSEFNAQFASFSERRLHGAAGKRWIARTAVGLIQPGMTLFMDSGTTVFAIAEALAASWPGEPLTVVSNNLPVVEKLAGVHGCEAHLLGGQFLSRQSVLLGPRALKALRTWRFDLLLLAAEGADRTGIWNSTQPIVSFQLAALERARRAALCLDRTKFGVTAPVPLFPWSDIPLLITNATSRDFHKINRDPADITIIHPGNQQTADTSKPTPAR